MSLIDGIWRFSFLRYKKKNTILSQWGTQWSDSVYEWNSTLRSTHTILPTNNKRLTTNDDDDNGLAFSYHIHKCTHTREEQWVIVKPKNTCNAYPYIYVHVHAERTRQLFVSMPPLSVHMFSFCFFSLSLNTFLFIAVCA